jgi:hypothetical protein
MDTATGDRVSSIFFQILRFRTERTQSCVEGRGEVRKLKMPPLHTRVYVFSSRLYRALNDLPSTRMKGIYRINQSTNQNMKNSPLAMAR